MDNYKTLCLTFKDAKLHQRLNKNGRLDPNGKDDQKYSGYSCNTDEIIGVNQVANVLHILMGLPPVPSKRKGLYSHNKEIFDIAKTAKIKYKNHLGVDNNGVLNGIEFGYSFKEKNNSHQALTTSFIIDGEKKILKGYWNWNTLRKIMYNGNKKDYYQWEVFYKFLKEFYGCDNLINKKSLFDIIKEISINNYSKIKTKIDELNSKKIFDGCIDVYRLFSGVDLDHIQSSNTSFKTQQPMIYNNGIRTYKSFSGNIIIKVPNYFIDIINENEGYCTILDGGFVTVKIEDNVMNNYNDYTNI